MMNARRELPDTSPASGLLPVIRSSRARAVEPYLPVRVVPHILLILLDLTRANRGGTVGRFLWRPWATSTCHFHGRIRYALEVFLFGQRFCTLGLAARRTLGGRSQSRVFPVRGGGDEQRLTQEPGERLER